MFFGDEANLNLRLPGYAVVGMNTAYDLTNNIQIYGIFNNILDKHYATYGTYFDIASVPGFTDPRSVVPAPLSSSNRHCLPSVTGVGSSTNAGRLGLGWSAVSARRFKL